MIKPKIYIFKIMLVCALLGLLFQSVFPNVTKSKGDQLLDLYVYADEIIPLHM